MGWDSNALFGRTSDMQQVCALCSSASSAPALLESPLEPPFLPQALWLQQEEGLAAAAEAHGTEVAALKEQLAAAEEAHGKVRSSD